MLRVTKPAHFTSERMRSRNFTSHEICPFYLWKNEISFRLVENSFQHEISFQHERSPFSMRSLSSMKDHTMSPTRIDAFACTYSWRSFFQHLLSSWEISLHRWRSLIDFPRSVIVIRDLSLSWEISGRLQRALNAFQRSLFGLRDLWTLSDISQCVSENSVSHGRSLNVYRDLWTSSAISETLTRSLKK